MLALDTSTRLGSVALGTGDEVMAETILSVRATYSETVLDEASRLMDRCGVRARDLDAVVVGAGPGSFTGVRIAASLAKGLCFANDLPLFAYSSLRVVAASAPLDEICALFDARRDEVYAAAFPAGASGGASMGPLAAPIDRLLETITASEWSFVGDGAQAHRDRIVDAGGQVLHSRFSAPRASALLWLAAVVPDEGRVDDRGSWEPDYVRASGAERRVGARA
ncbi:MAG: tRNA (adenosine(37)-N6)-threonylcarbamoyltransferase complex dimerization subunit type 1 TsaB [Gemmatimonadota bacterium]|nr:tRNA (adenosine(37)-N6)-threonylcarbamoyltransferase complex dimerization subunit type 1 TsaB [Gemmatimonadota bacterium]